MTRQYFKPSDRPATLRWTPRSIEDTWRTNPSEYTRTLTRPLTPVGPCHCGATGLLFPERRPGVSASGKRVTIVEWHCLLCRCDEHTPQSHGTGTTCGAARKGITHGCTRDLFDGPPEFPSFEEWVKTNGGAALRAAARGES